MSRTLKLISLVWLGLVLISATCAAANAASFGRQKLHGHRTSRMAEAPLVGEVSSDRKFELSVALPLRNADQLQEFLKQVSDPNSPLFRHYLTNEQFTEAYGPTQADYDSVVNYLKAKGLEVTATHSNRMIVSVRANKSDIQNAFHVGMHHYQRPDGTTFFGPDDEPSLDLDTPVLRIGGLDNYILPHPKMVISTLPNTQIVSGSRANAVTAHAGSGPSGLLMGNDFRNAYVPGVTLNGSGQSVALFELDTYYPADVQRYMSQAGLTNTVINVYLDGWSSSTTPGGGNGEVSLDIDQAMSMAPASTEYCYMGSNIDDVLNRIATDNICKQISSSWGWGPSSSTELQIEQQYAAQGQSYFNASGDSGSFTSDPGGNEDDPMQILVGGTNLNMNGSGASYNSETGWSGTTGGILTSLALPAYQTLIPMNNGASTTNRNCPDVSAVASGCLLYANNSSSVINVGGTSVAAPTWAGFMALVNQQAVGAGKPTVGFANPALYQIAQSNYTANFHDITSGSAGTFSAGPGYDLVTGIGSPNGQTLINSLSQAAGQPTATPTGTPTQVVSSTWRVRSGTTSAYTDCQNNVWSPDENYTGGNTNGNSNTITNALPCSTDGALYQNERYGNFSYVFHVPAGSYQVTLKFAELFDSGSGQRIENVSINGQAVLSNFDIFATAGGQNIAVDKVFSSIAPANGAITISVAPASGSPDQNAKIDAVQIVPIASSPTPTPCVPTAITPYLQVSGGAWQQASAVTILSGNTVNLGPQPTTGGSWSWTGPNSFTSTAREIDNIALSAGTNTYTATYTNPCGAVSTQAFTIVVLVPTSTPTNSPTLTSTFTSTATLTPVVKSTWRIAGGKANAYTDCQNNVWSPDSNYSTGNFNGNSNAITKALPCTTDQVLYQTEHWAPGGFTYSFNVPAGSYQVTLKFAEIFDAAAGQRIENVTINGTQVLTNFDIFADAGGANIADDKVFNNISPVNGTITIAFAPTSGSPDQNAKVDALQIVPQPATPTNTATLVNTSTNTATSTLSFTPTATWTSTATSTNSLTPVPPTATFTNTNSPVPPTATWTSTSIATGVTPPPTATNTSTVVNTSTSTWTATSVPPTATWTNSFTPVPPTATRTATSVPPTATWTFTAIPPTSTSTSTKTNTPVPPTATATWTFTAVPPTSTFTATKTNTSVPPTATATFTATKLPPTSTPTSIPPTSTPTTASICSGVPVWNGNFVFYSIGSKVTYNNELYQCIQAHTSEPNWMPPVVPALWKDLGSCTGAAPAIASSNTVIKSAVAGPNISHNFQPVHFYVQLNQPGMVEVDVFTPLGQKVVGTTFYGNAGMNNWLWDVQNASQHAVSSGLYIYAVRVTANGVTEVKTGKVVILH